MANEVVAGFSLMNRWLLYTSFMLAPAQFLSGLGNDCPSNIGFLAYNWYNEILWYRAIQNKELHALSIVVFNFIWLNNFNFLAGVSSGNIAVGSILGIGTGGLLVLNNVCGWTSWVTNLPEGYDVYQFFFFGWRTLNSNWHTFFAVWQVGDTIFGLILLILSITIAIFVSTGGGDELLESVPGGKLGKYPAILVGAAVMLFFFWPVIMWTELIIQRNNIVSETDWVAVWLFVAQVATMLVPGFGMFG